MSTGGASNVRTLSHNEQRQGRQSSQPRLPQGYPTEEKPIEPHGEWDTPPDEQGGNVLLPTNEKQEDQEDLKCNATIPGVYGRYPGDWDQGEYMEVAPAVRAEQTAELGKSNGGKLGRNTNKSIG